MTEAQKEIVRTMRMQGIGYRAIAMELNLKENKVYLFCKTHGLAGGAWLVSLNYPVWHRENSMPCVRCEAGAACAGQEEGVLLPQMPECLFTLTTCSDDRPTGIQYVEYTEKIEKKRAICGHFFSLIHHMDLRAYESLRTYKARDVHEKNFDQMICSSSQ